MNDIADTRTIKDFEALLQKALDFGGGTHTVENVVDMIMSGIAQLWVEGDAMVVTQVEEHPQKKIVRFWLGAGELDDVLDIQHAVIEWARSIGCEYAVIDGRKGWSKVLPATGWKESTRTYMKKIA